MKNNNTQQGSTVNELKLALQKDYVQEKFREVLGKKSSGFVASLLSIVTNNDLLSKAEPKSVLNAAMIAATLDLPINQNLGFAYIIPYNDRKTGTVVAQFQMGYKGFVQLGMRSEQFKTMNVTEVKEGEVKSFDRLSGDIKFEWLEEGRDSKKSIGYVAYFKLLNGFEKALYMTAEELKKHGVQYSQSAKKGYGLWNDDFDAMAKKTVLKLLLSKYAPLTTSMQTAQLADQAVIKEEDQYEYVDNKPLTRTEEALASDLHLEKEDIEKINATKNLQELADVCKALKEEKGAEYQKPLMKAYGEKKKALEEEGKNVGK